MKSETSKNTDQKNFSFIRGNENSLQGNIDKIIFYNPQNHYCVLKLVEEKNNAIHTAVGSFISPKAGITVKLDGTFIVDKKYGHQFKFARYEEILPSTENEISQFLSSGAIKGIGSVMASRIVEVFKEQTLDIIEQTPEKLLKIEGIGEKKLSQIRESWMSQRDVRKVMVFLQGHGISSSYAQKIYRAHGENSIEKVKENPYLLAKEVFGIGFKGADKIALQLGFEKNSLFRMQAAMEYVLTESISLGHLFLPKKVLFDKTLALIDSEPSFIEQAFIELVRNKDICRVFLPHEKTSDGFFENDSSSEACYTSFSLRAETGIVEHLQRILRCITRPPSFHPEKSITLVEQKYRFQLSEGQKSAISEAASNKCIIITGGPGTGKTTIIKSLLSIFQNLSCRVLLAAPTGRAAKRMEEVTGYKAFTLHKILEYNFADREFRKNTENPLEFDLCIIDEMSMVDAFLMYHFLKAVPDQCMLILVGDKNQLPSVGPGKILEDLIHSKTIKTIELSQIYRQTQDSRISIIAHDINEGKFPAIPLWKESVSDCYFYESEDPEHLVSSAAELLKHDLKTYFGFDPKTDVQVLTPMHRGILGVENLNKVIQNELNPIGVSIERRNSIFRIGDKVMQIRNNYEKEVFNGDLGIITSINFEESQISVNIDDRTIIYNFSEMDELVLAYCLTVHKSQGNEYKCVIIFIHSQHYIMLQKNLLYTALTRGKRMVILMGSKKALGISIKNNKSVLRYSLLKQRCMEMFV